MLNLIVSSEWVGAGLAGGGQLLLGSLWERASAPYPASVIFFPGGSKELGVGDGDPTERQVHLKHLSKKRGLESDTLTR